MDEFDYELDIDFDDENETIIIETNEDVINFDIGFYNEDKAVHILNLLSNNNLRIDVVKFKKYWDRKIANILTIDENKQEACQYNQNLFPLAEIKRKVSNYTDKPCVYEESEYITQPIEQYLLSRKDIIVPYYFSRYTENKQYTLLSPYETSQQGLQVLKDTDAFDAYHRGRIRLVAGADRLLTKGYISSTNTVPHIELDIAEYIELIESLEKGDPITIHTMDGTIHNGKCLENDVEARKLNISVNKKTLTYDYHNFSKNNFIVWVDSENQTQFNKSLFTNQSIIVKCDDSEYNHEAKEFLSLSANDVVALLLNEQPRTLDEIKNAFGDILDNVKRNKFLSDVFQKYKPPRIVKHKASKKLKSTQNNNKLNIEDVIRHIKEWLTLNTSAKVPSASQVQNLPSPFPEKNKYFFNIEDMYNDRPNNLKETAVLVTFASSYKIKKTIKYLDASAFSLVAKVVDNGQLAWDIAEQITLPLIKSQVTNSTTIKDALENLSKYVVKKQTYWTYNRLPFQYKGKRSYENFQGQGDTTFEDIAEFGVKMDKMDVEDEIIEDGISYEGTFLKYFVKHLAELFSIKLAIKQIEYISKSINLTRDIFESKGKQDALQVFKAFLVCTSMFLIFVQISFPQVISSASEATILSFPLIQTEPKNFNLVNHFVRLTETKVLKDPLFANILPSEVSLSGLFEHSITKVLKDKPIFTILLNTTRNNLVPTSNQIEKYGIWKTFRPIARGVRKTITKQKNKTIVHSTFIIRKQKESTIINNNIKLNQHKTHIETILNDSAILVSQWPSLGIFESNQYLAAISNAHTLDEKENAYNNISFQIDSITTNTPRLKEFVNNASSLKKDHLANFLFYDMKDLFGKILYNYVQTSEKENPNNKEYLQLFFATPIVYQEKVRAILQTFVDELSNLKQSNKEDDKYVYIYLILLLMLNVEEPFSNYLIEMFMEKFKYNSLTSQESMNLYLHDREKRKQKVMQVYNEMDDQIRRITKDFVEIGLITRDALINKELANENINLRIENENENYDMNEED